MYVYCLHGGTLPERYREVVFMREFGLKPWEMDPDRTPHATLGDLLDWEACLAGEAKARRLGRGGGQVAQLTDADYLAKGLPVPVPMGDYPTG